MLINQLETSGECQKDNKNKLKVLTKRVNCKEAAPDTVDYVSLNGSRQRTEIGMLEDFFGILKKC